MEDPDEIQLERFRELLSNPYRRFTLDYLVNESNEASIDTLVTAIDTWDEEKDITKRDVEIALRRTHLPRLAAADFITFGEEFQSVELTDDTNVENILHTLSQPQS